MVSKTDTKSQTNRERRWISHLLRRTGFGPTPSEIDRFLNTSHEDIVEKLLDFTNTTTMPDDVIFRMFPECHAGVGLAGASAKWVFRMATTTNPLEEKMALFWHGIFATGNDKLDNPVAALTQIDTLRRVSTDTFDSILLELSQDPAMLIWLDNQTNHKQSINENYGRELLELFSMGVGNYTEKDIKECARSFTGWSLNNEEYMSLRCQNGSIWPYHRIAWHYEYNSDDHDDQKKTFLGQVGNFNGEDIIRIICEQSSTAEFLSRHLYDFFVEDEEPVSVWNETPPKNPDAIKMLVNEYFNSGHSIKEMMKVLLNSDFFKESEYKKIKSPIEMVTGILKLTGEAEKPSLTTINAIEEAGYMGQLLLYPPSVEGWHAGEEWISSGSLVERVNFASSHMANITSPGTSDILDSVYESCGDSATVKDMVSATLTILGMYNVSEESINFIHESCGGETKTVDCNDMSRSSEFSSIMSDILRIIGSAKEFHLS